MTLAVVAVEVVRLSIVGYEQIQVSIVVEVAPQGSQAKEALWICHSGRFRHLSEGSIAVVVIERVRRPLQAARATLHGYAVILAGWLGAEFRQVLEIQIYVVGDKQVGPAIPVIVAKGRARRPAGVNAQPCLGGYIAEGAVVVVAEKRHPAKTRD